MHFKQLQDLTERLAALGAPVEADFQVALLLRGLPSEYDALRVAFVAKGTVTMSELREALRTEEYRLSSDAGSVGATSSSVLAAHGNNKSRNKGKQMNTSRRCYGCGLSGHYRRECPTNPYVQHRQKSKPAERHKAKQAEYCENTTSTSNDEFDDEADNSMFTALYGARVLPKASSDNWIIDSGAMKHMTPCHSMFVKYIPFRVSESVSLGNGTVCDALGIGRVAVDMLCDGIVKHYTLSDVLYVPHLVNNFFSVTAATLKGHEVTFKQKECRIQKDGQLIATGHCRNNVWYIDSESAHDNVCSKLNSGSNMSDAMLWHQRLGHVHE